VLGPDQTLYLRTSSRDGGSHSMLEAIGRGGAVKWKNERYNLPAVATDGTLYLNFLGARFSFGPAGT